MRPYHQLARHYGNEALFDLVEMSIISTLQGEPLHLHVEGVRGTGKTTILRAAQRVFPPIQRIKGCIYNCAPQAPHCPQHRDLDPETLQQLGVEWIPMPFWEISHTAKLGSVAGSIDLAKITAHHQPEAAVLPGLIPQAHRGVVFVDEINRLADTAPEITDLLLDVMGTKPGRIQIEEAGIPLVQLPVQVSVWAASNPDEDPGSLAEIRKQLSDRFDLVFDLTRPQKPETIAQILQQSTQRRQHTAQVFLGQNSVLSEPAAPSVLLGTDRLNLDALYLEEEKIQQKLYQAALASAELSLPDFLQNFLARLYVKYQIESLRALEAAQLAAVLYAGLHQRKQVQVQDILKVLPWAMQHRVEVEDLSKIMQNVARNLDGPSITNKAGNHQEEISETKRQNAPSQSPDQPIHSKNSPRKGRGFRGLWGSALSSENSKEGSAVSEAMESSLLKARPIRDVEPEKLLQTEQDLQGNESEH